MIKKLLFSIILIYVLVLLETSFFVHFNIFKYIPNTIFILIIAFNVIESKKKSFGLWSALAGGFLLDIFSTHFIGFYILILLATAFFLKFIFKHYVRIPFFEKT